MSIEIVVCGFSNLYQSSLAKTQSFKSRFGKPKLVIESTENAKRKTRIVNYEKGTPTYKKGASSERHRHCHRSVIRTELLLSNWWSSARAIARRRVTEAERSRERGDQQKA